MTFSEEAAELHRLEAVALSLGLTERGFEAVVLEVAEAGHATGTSPVDKLAEIRWPIHELAEARIQTKDGRRRRVGENGFAR